METVPKFFVWQAVTMRYADWDGEKYPVDAIVHSSEYFERPEWDKPGFHYMLRIPNVFDLDKVDRQALEGENRDLYGWVSESAIAVRKAGEGESLDLT